MHRVPAWGLVCHRLYQGDTLYAWHLQRSTGRCGVHCVPGDHVHAELRRNGLRRLRRRLLLRTGMQAPTPDLLAQRNQASDSRAPLCTNGAA